MHRATSPQPTVYLHLLIPPTLCWWFPLRWKQHHVNYRDHLVRAAEEGGEKSFLFPSQICTRQSETASNKPLGLRNSREEPRSGLGGFRSGVKLIFSWQFDSPAVLLLKPEIIDFCCWIPDISSLWTIGTVQYLFNSVLFIGTIQIYLFFFFNFTDCNLSWIDSR